MLTLSKIFEANEKAMAQAMYHSETARNLLRQLGVDFGDTLKEVTHNITFNATGSIFFHNGAVTTPQDCHALAQTTNNGFVEFRAMNLRFQAIPDVMIKGEISAQTPQGKKKIKEMKILQAIATPITPSKKILLKPYEYYLVEGLGRGYACVYFNNFFSSKAEFQF